MFFKFILSTYQCNKLQISSFYLLHKQGNDKNEECLKGIPSVNRSVLQVKTKTNVIWSTDLSKNHRLCKPITLINHEHVR